MSLEYFLNVLFDAGEFTCFTDSPHGYKIYKQPVDRDLFFAINPISPDTDAECTAEWHSPNAGRRADCNVVKMRNFLLEIDSLPVAEQRAYIDGLQIPYTSIVFSGSKSCHFIISLETPVTASEYRDIAARLHKLVTKADPSTKNPSRLSRLPFRVRPETGKVQELLYLGSRIPNSELQKILPAGQKSNWVARPVDTGKVSVDVMEFLLQPDKVIAERNLVGRNHAFYWLGKRLDDINVYGNKRAEYVHMAWGNLRDTTGFSLNEAELAARVKN